MLCSTASSYSWLGIVALAIWVPAWLSASTPLARKPKSLSQGGGTDFHQIMTCVASPARRDGEYELWTKLKYNTPALLEKQEPLPTLGTLVEEVKRCVPGAALQLDTPEWQDALQMLSDLGYALYCVARQQATVECAALMERFYGTAPRPLHASSIDGLRGAFCRTRAVAADLRGDTLDEHGIASWDAELERLTCGIQALERVPLAPPEAPPTADTSPAALPGMNPSAGATQRQAADENSSTSDSDPRGDTAFLAATATNAAVEQRRVGSGGGGGEGARPSRRPSQRLRDWTGWLAAAQLGSRRRREGSLHGTRRTALSPAQSLALALRGMAQFGGGGGGDGRRARATTTRSGFPGAAAASFRRSMMLSSPQPPNGFRYWRPGAS